MRLLAEYRPAECHPPFRLLDFMREMGHERLIMLGAGVPSPELLPRKEILESMQDADERTKGGFLGYHVPEGEVDLRTHLAERLRSRGVDLPADESSVITTTGATQALHLALSEHLAPGDLVAVESPCYYNLLEQIQYFKCQVLPIPSDPESGIDPEALESLATRFRPKVLVVCSSLSNPTGATIPDSARSSIVDFCREHGIHVIEDDIYAELCDRGAPRPLRAFDDGSSVTLVSSFCKTVAPGLRVGYILPGKRFESVASRKCIMDMHGSVITEATLLSFLQRPDSDDLLANLRRLFENRRHQLREAVSLHFPDGTYISDPAGGFLIWVVLTEALDMRILAQKALHAGVTLAMGDVFLTGPAERACMRLNAAKSGPEDIRRGVDILGQLLRQ
jgi:DNA-binding transcriptional MocR family regulator